MSFDINPTLESRYPKIRPKKINNTRRPESNQDHKKLVMRKLMDTSVYIADTVLMAQQWFGIDAITATKEVIHAVADKVPEK